MTPRGANLGFKQECACRHQPGPVWQTKLPLVLDDESYSIIKGAIEASEGIRVNMTVDAVLWRPEQIMYDPIPDSK